MPCNGSQTKRGWQRGYLSKKESMAYTSTWSQNWWKWAG